MEVSLVPHAFSGSGNSARISDLTIEKYASMAGDGAVHGAAGSTRWIVEWNEVRHNHGMGIRSGDGMWIYHNKVHNNGQLGLGGGGEEVLVEDNEISFNNYAGYSYYWEAGRAKFAYVRNLTVEDNYSHDNAGFGFWNDLNSQYVLYDWNQATRNKEAGILYELSYDATIRNNNIWDDGSNPNGPGIWWGAGILVSNSSNVTIYGNSVTNCMNEAILANRGLGPNGQPYLVQNLDVHDNTITQVTGTAAGIVKTSGFDNSVYTSWNNHFQDNRFILTYPATYDYFFWLGEPMTSATRNSYPH